MNILFNSTNLFNLDVSIHIRPLQMDKENVYAGISLKTEGLVLKPGGSLTLENLIIDGRDLPAGKHIPPLDCLLNSLPGSADCCNPLTDYINPGHPCFLKGINHSDLNKNEDNHCFLKDEEETDSNIIIINSRITNFYAVKRYRGFSCFSENKVLSISNSNFSGIFFPFGIFHVKNSKKDRINLGLTFSSLQISATNFYGITFEGSKTSILTGIMNLVSNRSCQGILISYANLSQIISDTLLIKAINWENLEIQNMVSLSVSTKVLHVFNTSQTRIMQCSYQISSLTDNNDNFIFIDHGESVLIDGIQVALFPTY